MCAALIRTLREARTNTAIALSGHETDGAGITWPKYAGADSQTLAYLATEKDVVQWKLGRAINDLCK